MRIIKDNSAAAFKRQILKEDYPQNLILAIINGWKLEAPKELTSDIIAGVNYALSTLKDREQAVLRMRYEERKTLSEVGACFGFKQERARQIEITALGKLRRPPNWMYIANGIIGYTSILCKSEYDRGYQIGYNSGYKQGVTDAPKGIPRNGFTVNILTLSVDTLGLSTRAYNALKRAGYNTLGDIVDLDYFTIIHIKNLGTAQRYEVASGLQRYGLTPTEWDDWIPQDNKNDDKENKDV